MCVLGQITGCSWLKETHLFMKYSRNFTLNKVQVNIPNMLVDSFFAIHPNMKSQYGIFMELGEELMPKSSSLFCWLDSLTRDVLSEVFHFGSCNIGLETLFCILALLMHINASCQVIRILWIKMYRHIGNQVQEIGI